MRPIMGRSIIPVGQGAFCCERFRTSDNEMINIVYDCGTEKDENFIKTCIESKFHKDEIIQAIFVSHFHKDYISGIKHLIEHCYVKNIILPIISDEAKIMLYFQLGFNNSNDAFAKNLINNSKKAVLKLQK